MPETGPPPTPDLTELFIPLEARPMPAEGAARDAWAVALILEEWAGGEPPCMDPEPGDGEEGEPCS